MSVSVVALAVGAVVMGLCETHRRYMPPKRPEQHAATRLCKLYQRYSILVARETQAIVYVKYITCVYIPYSPGVPQEYAGVWRHHSGGCEQTIICIHRCVDYSTMLVNSK